MYICLKKSYLSGFLAICIVSTILCACAATAEEVNLPIPIPLKGDMGQAGLYFAGLPYPVSPDISSIWCDTPGVLSFVIRGDITALYHWYYDQGQVQLSNVKCEEEDADSFLLEGAQENHIAAIFEQEQSLYGIDGLSGNLMLLDNGRWNKIASIDWGHICALIGFAQIDFEDAAKRPYQFVKTDSMLYCLIPNGTSSPFLVSADLEAEKSRLIDCPTIRGIAPYESDDLLIQSQSMLKRYAAASEELIDTLYCNGSFVYDRARDVLFYENDQQLYESKDLLASREICTPEAADPYHLIALPQGMLAVCWEQGISIVNTALSPGKRLQIEEPTMLLPLSSDLFSLANPDVMLETVNTVPDDSGSGMNGGIPDIVTMLSISEIPEYAARNDIASLAASVELQEIVQTYYPQIQDAIRYDNELFAIPLGLYMTCYQADQTAWELAGSPDIPQSLDSFMRQIDQFATSDRYDASQTYLGEVLYDLTKQYATQYQSDLTPVRFDTPLYRSILSQIKSMAARGVTGSVLYFSPHSPGWETPWYLCELGRDHQFPSAFPAFESGQMPKLDVRLDICAINSQTDNFDLAIRYLEFICKYADEDLKCSFSPQYHPVDIITRQQEVIDFLLQRLRLKEAGIGASNLADRISLLEQKYQLLQEKEPFVTSQGLAFYRNNATHMSLERMGFYDFVWTHFTSFLQGSLSADELIEKLNRRAYEDFMGLPIDYEMN